MLTAILAAGCQSAKDNNDPQNQQSANHQSDNQQSADQKVTVAGIYLGESTEAVKEKLGENYTSESMGNDWFGEQTSRWNYGENLEVIVGEETNSVLQINLYSDAFTAANGEKTGVTAGKVLPAYLDKYPLAKDHFEGKEIPGWFVVDEGVWLIFNFKDDDTMVNQEIADDETVQSIHLVYEKFMH
jgi:hypothetical protein